jgi:hypothetical protein
MMAMQILWVIILSEGVEEIFDVPVHVVMLFFEMILNPKIVNGF